MNYDVSNNSFILQDIDLKGGVVTYNDFVIDPKLSFIDQDLSYNQDLLQVSFLSGLFVVDLGWYPDFDPNGYFKLYVIKKYDWVKPVFRKKTRNFNVLKKNLQRSINIVSHEINLASQARKSKFTRNARLYSRQ